MISRRSVWSAGAQQLLREPSLSAADSAESKSFSDTYKDVCASKRAAKNWTQSVVSTSEYTERVPSRDPHNQLGSEIKAAGSAESCGPCLDKVWLGVWEQG